MLVFDLGELAEQLFLAGRQVPRGLDDDLDELVAAAPAADVGHAAALDPEDVAALGPRGTSRRSGPSSVGTSISAPRAAWAKLIGTWQNRSLRLRSKNGCLRTRIWIRRLPRGAPRSPGSPWPRSWSHMPLSTPGGTSTLRLTAVGIRPEPRQLGQGSVIRTPSPPQAGQVVATWKKPAGLDDLALAAAVVAGRRDGPLACARALALAAVLLPVDVDRLGRAPRGLEKLDLELDEQVLAGPRPAPALAEQVAEEAAAEDVAEGRHDVFGVAEVVDPRPFEPGVAVAVVTLRAWPGRRGPRRPRPLP